MLHLGIFWDLVMAVHVHEEAAEHEGYGAEEKDEEIEEYVPAKKRRLMAAQQPLHKKAKVKGATGTNAAAAAMEEPEALKTSVIKPSLLVKSAQLKKDTPEITKTKAVVMQELEIDRFSEQQTPLKPVNELA